MIDLVQLAGSLTAKGVVASVDVRIWDGYLPPKPEWGNVKICAFSGEMSKAFLEASEMFDNLLASYSIPCCDGFFIPERSLSKWSEEHSKLEISFNKAKQSVMAASDIVKQSVRSLAAERAVAAWKEKNPDDQNPPPSFVMSASNLASSMVPRKEEFLESYGVSRRMSEHSFSFCARDKRAVCISKNEYNYMAWRVVDELVAGNVRRLDTTLRRALKKWVYAGKKLEEIQEGVLAFSRTDIMPELGIAQAIGQLSSMIENKMAADINMSKVYAEAGRVADFTGGLTTVSEVLGRLQCGNGNQK